MKKILIPLAILGLAALATVILVRSRGEVEKSTPESPPPIVRVMAARPVAARLDVLSQGTVAPLTEADLVAEVAGTVVRVSPSFQEGGFFGRGEVLLELDRRDYELNVASARAQVSQAQVMLHREQAEAEVAREEWQELGSGEPSPLVLREPQLEEAKARIEAAEAVLARAELDLSRTVIRAPFAGRLRAKRVDRGEFVNRGTPLATIYSTDRAEIRVMVPDADLAFLDLAALGLGDGGGGGATADGPAVTLRANFAGRSESWRGRVVRTGGEIDPRSRMVPVIVQVERPYAASEGRLPLSVGLFVEAEIEGRSVEGVFQIPRSAFRDQDTLLIVDDDDRVRARRVGILRASSDHLIVDRGLRAGERICLQPLDWMLEGMKVRPNQEVPTPLSAPNETPSPELPTASPSTATSAAGPAPHTGERAPIGAVAGG